MHTQNIGFFLPTVDHRHEHHDSNSNDGLMVLSSSIHMANNSSTEAEEIHTIFGSQNNSLSCSLHTSMLYVNSINDVKAFSTLIVVYVKVRFDIGNTWIIFV
uniref:Uncharacterized protein n=1 Tax=Glossina pallidipes TaxID=7398 RepID=A0A1A9ZAM0_GLOPL